MLPLAAALALVLTATSAPAVSAAREETRRLVYRGYTFEVPASWPVYDLTRAPSTCVRFDRHAVYLGRPGTDQRCPARALGRTEAILVEPLDDRARSRPLPGPLAPAGSLPPAADNPVSQEFHVVHPDAGVAVTATYGRDRPTVTEPLDRASLTPGHRPAAAPSGRATHGTGAGAAGASPDTAQPADGEALVPSGRGRQEVTYPPGSTATRLGGKGFDTCTAPSIRAMNAWLASPYRAVGIYIGGIHRACGDGNLSAAWVGAVAAKGWRVMPIYVGLQAPCTRFHYRIDPAKPGQQGAAAASDAVTRARQFGLAPGSTIYYDMEGYGSGSTCRRAVLTFLTAWTARLHAHGYLSGVYSSSASGIADLAESHNSAAHFRPDAIWMANWNGRDSVFGDRYVPDEYWPNHQRAHQYRGPHDETYRGFTITIDSNAIEAPLGSVSYRHKVTAGDGARQRGGPGTEHSVTGTHQLGTVLAVLCQTFGEEVGRTRVWNRLTDGGYVSDSTVDTPGVGDFSPPIPRCAHPFPVSARDGLRVREAPGSSHPVVRTLPDAALAYVQCRTKGDEERGTEVWNGLSGGGYASDAYLRTPNLDGSRATLLPPCESGQASTSSASTM